MPVPILQAAVNAGEWSPALFGRSDLDKYKRACSTLRNMFASYRGGASSRAGLAFVGQSKQPGTSVTPQLIPFQFSVTQGYALELGDEYMRFVQDGGYVLESDFTITGITQASPGVFTAAGHNFSNGDWVFLSGIGGAVNLNNRIGIVANSNQGAGTFTLENTLTLAAISTAGFPAYTSGGTVARLYTIATPYAASDLPLLKWTQSADVMSLTHPSYPPYDLTRITNTDWTLLQTTFAASIAAPATLTAGTTIAGTTTFYGYCVTAVSDATGEESVASPVAYLQSQNIATVAGSIALNWAGVTGASSFNVYKALESYNGNPPVGAPFGFLGTALGLQFVDTNITADFTKVPPVHDNPFATSSVSAVPMKAFGASYSATGTTVSIVGPGGGAASGTGFAGQPVIQGGQLQWVLVENGGQGFSSGDKPNFIDATGSGSGASGTLTLTPATGTYPGTAAYFQERRFYASTANDPDTYFASKPGAFTNFDSSTPTVDDDAITGTPWGQQVNGIQFMLNMPGGLVIMTGLGAWQLSGGGGGLSVSAAITPSNQTAVPQAFSGCAPTIRPIPINYDILFVQQKGSIVRDLRYNLFFNIYTSTDTTLFSNHLFQGHTIERWDWAEEPNKLLWAVREDGVLLCLTFLAEQEVQAWSRHDTNGLFQSVCVVSEPPVNAPYFIVKRLIQNDGAPVWAYYLERMDNRIWQDVESVFCVDAGLSYSAAEPNATLTFSSATGVGTLNQPTLEFGGANYSAETYALLTDPTGAGASASLVIANGVVTQVSVSGDLTGGYTAPQFTIIDPTGAGAGAIVNIDMDDLATVTSSSGVFQNAAGSGEAGDVIRAGGGIAQVTAFGSSTSLTVNMIRPIAQVIANDPLNTPVPFASTAWTIAAPITTVLGLDHLEGMTVSILADGVVVTPQIVSGGSITLPQPATAITVGLGFTAQLQTLYLDMPGANPTIQGRRKTIFDLSVRVENTGGPFEIGANQPDQSVQADNLAVAWANLTELSPPYPSQQPAQPFALFTGDLYEKVADQLGGTQGQVCVQQRNPLPLGVLALVPGAVIGDDPGE